MVRWENIPQKGLFREGVDYVTPTPTRMKLPPSFGDRSYASYIHMLGRLRSSLPQSQMSELHYNTYPRRPALHRDPSTLSRPEIRRLYASRPVEQTFLTRGNVVVSGIILTCTGIWYFASDALRRALNATNAGGKTVAPIRPGSSVHGFRDEGASMPSASAFTSSRTSPAPKALPDRIRSVIDFNFVRDNLVLSQRNIDQGRPWTLLTHTFTHISGTHLLLNMFGLWSFGPGFIMTNGLRHFAAIWVGSGVSGGLAGLWSARRKADAGKGNRDQWSVGASAAALGIVFANLIPNPHLKVAVFPLVSFGHTSKTIVMHLLTSAALACPRTREFGHDGHVCLQCLL